MENGLTNDTKAIILLCGALGKGSSVKPLTQVEYTRLVQWLIHENMRPADLLNYNEINIAAAGCRVEADRLKALLGRGVQLGFAVEEWQQKGIWIISRSDEDYPKRLKKHLKDKAPPLLFGVGNRALLQGGGLAIVGSRNVDSKGAEFTKKTAELCAFNSLPVVSGGARGVDQIAMSSSLDAGGTTIGILADSLLKKSLERQSRNAINDKRLLLISPYHPNARFTVGTAMGRNKLIYSMSDYGLVVSAEYNKGGTWSGAKEELSRDQPVTVFSRQGDNVPKGNMRLLELGAIPWPEKIEKANFLQQVSDLSQNNREQNKPVNISIYDLMDQEPLTVSEPMPDEQKSTTYVKSETNESQKDAIYQAVLPVILEHLEQAALPEELADKLDVAKSQLNKWLKKAVEEGKIKKLLKPVRYQATK